MWLRLVRRDIFSNRRFSWFFILSLTMGLVGFITIDGFRRSFSEVLQQASQNLLTADLSISARRTLTDDELNKAGEIVGPNARHQDVRTLYSMAANGAVSALVQLKAVEDSYPFYGWLELQKQGKVYSNTAKTISSSPKIWVAPDVLVRLQAKVGDELQIGKQKFLIDDVVVDSSSSSFAGEGLAPRAYIGIEQLPATELVQKGSILWHERLFKLTNAELVESVKAQLERTLIEPGLHVDSHEEAAQSNGRVLKYLSDYLGLVALVAFFLAAVGSSYLFRSYLLSKQKDIAILLSLGMTHGQAIRLHLLQIAALGLVASLLASAVSAALIPLSEGLIKNLTPLPFAPRMTVKTLAVATLLGVLGSVLICLPLFRKIRELNPSSLFQEYANPQLELDRKSALYFMPALLCFYGLAVWQASSWKVGSIFFGCLAGSALLFSLLGWLLLRLLERFSPVKPLPVKMSVRYLSRHKVQAISCFLAMSLGSLLINLIPQIGASLEGELTAPSQFELPSFFMFDIQEEQAQPLTQLLRDEKLAFQQLSPMIRGRLSERNGQPFEKDTREVTTREEEQEQRMRNRGVNLSYRQQLSNSEEIVDGRPFSGVFDFDKNPVAELSIEQRYADRLGLELGDELTFDVQSLPIKGRVVNFRKVKWNSFQPNFFIQFQEGVLEDAPKTFVGSVPAVPAEQKYRLQSRIVQEFPNVSIIDVTLLVQKVLEMLRQMGFILNVMAWFSLAAGVVVLYFIANHQAVARRWDSNLLKILGASRGQVYQSSIIEFAILGFFAAVLGSLAGIVGSFILAKALFDGTWAASWEVPLTMSAAIVAISVVSAYLSQRKVLREKPSLYLQQN